MEYNGIAAKRRKKLKSHCFYPRSGKTGGAGTTKNPKDTKRGRGEPFAGSGSE